MTQSTNSKATIFLFSFEHYLLYHSRNSSAFWRKRILPGCNLILSSLPKSTSPSLYSIWQDRSITSLSLLECEWQFVSSSMSIVVSPKNSVARWSKGFSFLNSSLIKLIGSMSCQPTDTDLGEATSRTSDLAWFALLGLGGAASHKPGSPYS